MKRRRMLAGLGVSAALLGGCAGDTGSQRFGFQALVGGSENATQPLQLTNALGWQIRLTRADVTLGPLYLNVVPPLRASTAGEDAPAGRGWQRWLDALIPTAHAQAEHLAAGRIVGEVLGQVRFSALSPELVAFPVAGDLVAEPVRSVEVWFYPEPGVAPETQQIDTAALELEGSATLGDSSVAFRGALRLNADWLGNEPPGARGSTSITALRQLRGIGAELSPHEGGHLELRFDVSRLLRGADFSVLEQAPADTDGVKLLQQAPASRDQVMSNLYQGLLAADSYTARWVDP